MGQGDKSQKKERRLSAYYSLDQRKELKSLGIQKIIFGVIQETSIAQLKPRGWNCFQNGKLTIL